MSKIASPITSKYSEVARAQPSDGFAVFVGLMVGEATFVGIPGDAGVDVGSPPEIGIWATAVGGVGVEVAPVPLVSSVIEDNPAAGNSAEGVLSEGDPPKAGKSATSTPCVAGVSRIGGALTLAISDTVPTPIKIKAVSAPASFNSATSFSSGICTGFS